MPVLCKTCKKEKDPEEFYDRSYKKKDGSVTTKKRSECIPCHIQKCVERTQNCPVRKEKHRVRSYKHNIKRLYGISIEEYEAMLEKQGKACYICNSFPTSKKFLCVDHCHTTGKIRGLLCDPCNKALGLLKEDKARLENMIRYIDEHNKSLCVGH